MLIESTGRLDTVRLKSGKTLAASVCAVFSVLLVSSCAGQQGGGSDSGGTPTSAANGSAVEVQDPKDAASVNPCALLPAQGAESLQLLPQGQLREGTFGSDEKNSCRWESEDGAVTESLGVAPGMTLKDYDVPDAYVDFQRLTIAGHPALRANSTDPKTGGTCAFFVASNSNQVVQSTGQVDNRPVDPCELAQKALELAVPTWPAAK